jgi:hypothetical protein
MITPGIVSNNSPRRDNGRCINSSRLACPFDADGAIPIKLSAFPSTTTVGNSAS